MKTRRGDSKERPEEPRSALDSLMAEYGEMGVEVVRQAPSRRGMQRAMNQALLSMLDRPSLNPHAGRRRAVLQAMRFIIRLEFRGIEPKIWRRFSVPGDLQARDLVKVVRKVAGWSGTHMDGLHFPRPAPSLQRPLLVAERLECADTLVYTYDFGDSWAHDLLVESVERMDVVERAAIMIDGARACPPEDCGGVAGYARLCRALVRGRLGSPILRWLRGVQPRFDPERFDVVARNARSLSRLRLRFGIPPKTRRRKRRS